MRGVPPPVHLVYLCSKKRPPLSILIEDSGGFMDLAGIEPASESSSIQASPITVIIRSFPPLPA